MEEEIKEAIKLCENLLSLLELSGKVTARESDGYIYLNIDSPDAGLLIGRSGQTLDAFETILSLIFAKRIPDGPKISVDVSLFRKGREDELTLKAKSTAQRVIETGQPEEMANLTPRERRIIHVTLAQETRINTESFGEGESRTLVIKKI